LRGTSFQAAISASVGLGLGLLGGYVIGKSRGRSIEKRNAAVIAQEMTAKSKTSPASMPADRFTEKLSAFGESNEVVTKSTSKF
jgi:hypothetical protein